MYRNPLDLDLLFRPRLLVHLQLLQVVQYLLPFDQLPKDGVLPIQADRSGGVPAAGSSLAGGLRCRAEGGTALADGRFLPWTVGGASGRSLRACGLWMLHWALRSQDAVRRAGTFGGRNRSARLGTLARKPPPPPGDLSSSHSLTNSCAIHA